jgi:uncharacterized protein with PIN domain
MQNVEGDRTAFVADVMLGRLARWMRAAGWDTAYDPCWSDNQLVRLARAESRILLTRDLELVRRPAIVSLLIASQRLEDQLRQVAAAFHLKPHWDATRCMLCNVPLESVSRPQLKDQVPPYVYATHSHFKRCTACGRIYWQGSHWHHIVGLLAKVGAAVVDTPTLPEGGLTACGPG